MNHVTHPLGTADISFFFTGNLQLLLHQQIWIMDIDCILVHNFYFFWPFFESLKFVLINMVAILIMSAKLGTLSFLKIKVFWNKSSDVIISVHDITSKILSHSSNYIVDVVMWSKFVHSNISMRRVITTAILLKVARKKFQIF